MATEVYLYLLLSTTRWERPTGTSAVQQVGKGADAFEVERAIEFRVAKVVTIITVTGLE